MMSAVKDVRRRTIVRVRVFRKCVAGVKMPMSRVIEIQLNMPSVHSLNVLLVQLDG